MKPRTNDTPAEPATPRRFGARTYAATVVTRGFIQLCTVGSGVMLARMLGPDGRGILAAAILWPSLFAHIGLFGLAQAITRVAARERQTGAIARTSLLFTLGISALTASGVYFLLPHLIPHEKVGTVLPLATLALLLIPVGQFLFVLGGIVQGTGDFRLLNTCVGSQTLLYVSLLFAAWMSGLNTATWCLGAMVVSIALVTAVYLLKLAPSIISTRDWYSPTELLATTWRYGAAIVGREVYQVVDKALLLWLLTEAEMAYYLAGLASASVVSGCIQALGTVGLTECAKSPPRRGFPHVASMFRKAIVLWLLIGGALGIAMPILLPFVYGNQFAPAVTVSIILLFGIGAFGITGMLDLCMFGEGKPLLGLASRLAGTVMMATTGLVLARFGNVGIATANVGAQWCCLLSFGYLVCRHYDDSDPSLLVPKSTDFLAIASLVLRACRQLFPKHKPVSDDDTE